MLASIRLAVLVALLSSLLPTSSRADRYRLDGRYDARVPAPESVLGFELGDRPARYDALVRYAEALAAASPRVRLERYARSHEGRDLLLLVISSEANLARLDAIRADRAMLADPRMTGEARARSIVRNTPAVAYMAYAIHGDELSSADAAARVAYELAAGETDDVRKMLDNLVVLIDPMENPDGRERILSISGSYLGAVPNPDPDALSHSGFWPWGRGNHYLFDLNRDWFALVHPESRGRAAILREWRPQLVVDSHEMGYESTYLFNPPRDPFNPNLPRGIYGWWERFASDQARAFDRQGWSYYTREWAEELYPGYGSSLAMYQGAVGILYEQSGTDGQPIRKPSGRIEHYRDAVAHHFVSSMANLATAAENREALLQGYRESRIEATRRGQQAPARAFYFAPHPDRARAERLATRLAALGIEVDRLETPGRLADARTFWRDGGRPEMLPAGTFRVRLAQPDGLLARAVLEPHTPLPDSTLAMEREQLERDKGSRLYDVTAWSPLLASGLEAWWSPRLDDLRWTPVRAGDAPSAARGGLAGGDARYGWLFDGTADGALVLAARLASRGFSIRAGEKPFQAGGRSYPRGSFLLRAEDNPAKTAEVLKAMGDSAGVEIIPVAGARITQGPDLGGDHWLLLREARIAIAAGPPLAFTSVGWAWNLLDRELDLRVSLLDVARLGETDLARYNVLVLPNVWGGSDAYRRALGEAGLKAVREWIEDGGTLVGLEGGALTAADSSSGLSSVRPRAQARKDFPPPAFGLDGPAIRALERMQATGIGADGKPVQSAGLLVPGAPFATLGIPGAGSPVLGPGTWALLGTMGDAARRRAAQDTGRAAAEAKPSEEASVSEAEQELARTRADERMQRFHPSGAILRVDLDPEHWLAFGCGERVAAMMQAEEVLLARDPVTTVGRFAGPSTLHVGGLLWPEAAGRIAQTAYATRESRRRGQIILFAGDPNFRGYFWGTERLFLNAVLLGPGLGTRHTVPW